MRIHTKLLLTALLATLGVAGVGGLGFYFTEQSTRALVANNHAQHQLMQRIFRLRGQLDTYWLDVVTHVGTHQPEAMNRLGRRVAEREETIARELRALGHWRAQHQSVLDDAGLESAIEAVRQRWEGFLPAAREVIQQSEGYAKSAAASAADAGGRPLFAQLATSLEQLSQQVRASHDAHLAQAHEDRRDNLLIMILATFAAGLLIFIWQRRIGGELVFALGLISTRVERLAQGWISQEERAYRGAPELMRIIRNLNRLREGMAQTIGQADAVADGDFSREIQLLSERDELGKTLARMTHALRESADANQTQNWLKSGLAELNRITTGDQTLPDLSYRVLAFIARYLNAPIGALYLLSQENDEQPAEMRLFATYAYTTRKELSARFELGEGLVGQAALERKPIWVRQVEDSYCILASSLIDQHPRKILAAPFLYSEEVKGVIELGVLAAFSPAQQTFLDEALASLGIVIHSAQARARMRELLERSRRQASKLQTQAEEMSAQQEELRASNEELAQRGEELENQRREVSLKNQELEQSQQALATKAEELTAASRYKSEFLANMSHELRTPLNSMLLLADLLAKNSEGNLTDKQRESARTIHHAGSELLNLINDILDLSKVEAGRIELHNEDVVLADVADSLERKFRPLAEHKNLYLKAELAKNLPGMMRCDGQRLQQVITNFLSNGIKFTRQGGITLSIRRADKTLPRHPGLPVVGFHARDTGIGISEDKLHAIFDAFHQADGAKTTREFGGTGLGLSISRQLAELMEGAIDVTSQPGEGSTFSLYLPLLPAKSSDAPADPVPLFQPLASPPTTPTASPAPETLVKPQPDPKPAPVVESESPAEDPVPDGILAGKEILLVDDDMRNSFSLIRVLDPAGLEVSIATNGKEALDTLQDPEGPNFDLVLMDLMMPEMDGLETTRAIRAEPRFATLPIIVLSAKAMPNDKTDSEAAGANAYLTKPVDTTQLLETMAELLEKDANE